MAKYESFFNAPFAVRQRYIQIRYAKYIMFAVRIFMRVKLMIHESKKNRKLTEVLETYRVETERARSTGNECMQLLMNIGLFYLIAEKDIQTVKIDALTHYDSWKRSLSLRVILLTIYEWNMGKASTGNLKDLLTQSSVDESLQEELFHALRLLRKSQEKAAKLLRFERNATIAHRDSDALLQLKTIQGLNQKKVFGAASDFYESSNLYLKIFPLVVQQAGSMEGLFSFMLNKNRGIVRGK